MAHRPSHRACTPLFFVAASCALARSPCVAQRPPVDGWSVTQPRGTSRQIDFVTTEGTWLSIDISADERSIVFDLLGHIYRLPITGGDAVLLTGESGVAINSHPRF